MAASDKTVSYDVIIVGGGHNGLTCAAFLARAGKNVVVLESLPKVGGYCNTLDPVPEAPGFMMNTAGIDHIFTHVEPTVIDDLNLGRYGLRYVDIDPLGTYLGPDGTSLTLWQDLDRACAEIARYSRHDAERYPVFVNALADAVHVLVPYLTGHPKRVRPADVLDILKRAAKKRKSLATAVRILMASPTAALDEWFESEELKSALIAYTSFSLTPIDTPGLGLSFLPVQHRWGLRRPVGGSGSYSDALARFLEAHGGEIRTSTSVKEILVEGGRARGVTLGSGETLYAEHVVGALDPMTLLTKLLDPELLPEKVRLELAGMQVGAHNLGGFKVDIALSGRPDFPNYPSCSVTAVSQAMLTTYEEVRVATRQAMNGELPTRPPVTVWRPTHFDRSLLPAGSTGESLYLYPIATPVKLSNGREWKTEKDQYLQRCLDVLEEFSPGIRDLILGVHVQSPDDFPSYNGNIYHVDMLQWQLGPWRPTPSLSGYRTPIDGLWHTAAGAHPMAGISGWSGRTTARSILKDLGAQDGAAGRTGALERVVNAARR